MPRPLLPWLRPAPAPIAAAIVQRSSSVKPTCTSGAFRLAPPTRTSSNSANRKYLFPDVPYLSLPVILSLSVRIVVLYTYMSSHSIPIYSCKDTGTHIQELMQSCKCTHRRSGKRKKKKVTVLGYREEYGP